MDANLMNNVKLYKRPQGWTGGCKSRSLCVEQTDLSDRLRWTSDDSIVLYQQNHTSCFTTMDDTLAAWKDSGGLPMPEPFFTRDNNPIKDSIGNPIKDSVANPITKRVLR